MQDQDSAGQGKLTGRDCQHQQAAQLQEPEQHHPRQQRLSLQCNSQHSAEHVEAAAPRTHVTAAAEQLVPRQAKNTKQERLLQPQSQQPKPKRGSRHQEEVSLESDGDDVPSTYNNMPARQKQHPLHNGFPNQNFAPEEEDAVEAKDKKPTGARQVQQKNKGTAQNMCTELEFELSDAESDEYEPTQAKAAAKAAARRPADRAPAAKRTKGKPQDAVQEAASKAAPKTAKGAAEEGNAKRPRGRPRKGAPQRELQAKANRRKAAETLDEEAHDDRRDCKATGRVKAHNGGRLQKVALKPATEEAEEQDAEVRGVIPVTHILAVILLLLQCTIVQHQKPQTKL